MRSPLFGSKNDHFLDPFLAPIFGPKISSIFKEKNPFFDNFAHSFWKLSCHFCLRNWVIFDPIFGSPLESRLAPIFPYLLKMTFWANFHSHARWTSSKTGIPAEGPKYPRNVPTRYFRNVPLWLPQKFLRCMVDSLELPLLRFFGPNFGTKKRQKKVKKRVPVLGQKRGPFFFAKRYGKAWLDRYPKTVPFFGSKNGPKTGVFKKRVFWHFSGHFFTCF